jgi:hypothetical protein
MRRREFITVLGGGLGIVLAAWPLAIVAREADNARIGGPFDKIKREYGKLSHPSETARADYITRLTRLREQAVRRNRREWKAIDAKIKQHPALSDTDSKTLTALLIGDWESPRHDYRFRTDGTLIMLPDEEGATNSAWRIEGNQYFDGAAVEAPKMEQYTIILLTKRDFVFMDNEAVFYETREK